MIFTLGCKLLRIGHRAIAVLHVAGLLALMPASANAQSQCTITANVSSIAFNAISMGRDTAPGTPLSEIQTVTNSVSCPSEAPSGYYLQLISVTPASSVVSGVWETGTPGVGARVIDLDYGNAELSGRSFADFGPVVGNSGSYTGTYRFTVQLIKTGQATASTGQVSVAVLYYLQSHNIRLSRPSSPQAQLALGATAFTARSCTVSTPIINVPLADVSAASLGYPGASAGTTAFSIGLQCDTGGTVYITLTDATNPGNVTDVLSLTRDSTAAGVGIRIRNPSNTSVSFGPDSPAAGNVNQWLVGPSATTSSIPMTAEYIATGAVTPGTVRAVATFTMSYQ